MIMVPDSSGKADNNCTCKFHGIIVK